MVFHKVERTDDIVWCTSNSFEKNHHWPLSRTWQYFSQPSYQTINCRVIARPNRGSTEISSIIESGPRRLRLRLRRRYKRLNGKMSSLLLAETPLPPPPFLPAVIADRSSNGPSCCCYWWWWWEMFLRLLNDLLAKSRSSNLGRSSSSKNPDLKKSLWDQPVPFRENLPKRFKL